MHGKLLDTRWLRHLVVLSVLALLAAACGGGGGDEDAGGDTGADTAEETETGAESESPTESEPASESETATEGETAAAAANTGDGTFVVGTLLPETGSLAFLGPPEFAGAELAVNDINEAGGVLDSEVTLIQGDSGDTTTDIANQTVDRLLAQNADVIVGAASSAVSLTVIDKITGAGVVQFSPANTSDQFSDYNDRDLYFRTAPPDVLQGRILGDTILADGNATVALLALQDAYGEGLLQNASQAIQEAGGEVVLERIYDPQAQNFDAEVQEVVSAAPDAVAVIGFDESARILTTMIEQGVGPQDVAVYGTDGNMGNALGEAVAASLQGMRGTLPGSVATEDFQERLATVDPNLIDYSYAGETYDAIIVSALAAEVAGTDAPTEFAQEIPGVTRDGQQCTDFAACLELIQAGEDIDYDGVSGPIELNDVGDPTQANFQILEFDENNTVFVESTATASLEG